MHWCSYSFWFSHPATPYGIYLLCKIIIIIIRIYILDNDNKHYVSLLDLYLDHINIYWLHTVICITISIRVTIFSVHSWIHSWSVWILDSDSGWLFLFSYFSLYHQQKIWCWRMNFYFSQQIFIVLELMRVRASSFYVQFSQKNDLILDL